MLNRRTWLKNALLTSAGLSLTGLPQPLFAAAPPPRKPDGFIRLSGNENPYGPSKAALKAMKTALAESNRYPRELRDRLREEVARSYGLRPENILLGAGSSEILGLAALRAGLQRGNVVAADPTFRIWMTLAERTGLQIRRVPLDAGKVHDLAGMRAQVDENTRLVYLCNPNNPTGTVLPDAALRAFVRDISARTTILLDEAYTEYAGLSSLAPLVADNPNLLVVRTFSKIYGLAGARVGYAVAHADTIKALADLQPWSNAGVSAVSLAAALAALDDTDFVAASRQKNTAVRDFTAAGLRALDIPVIPSQTNFLYYSVAAYAGDFIGALKNANIEVGRIVEEEGRWTRVSIGTQEEMEAFLVAAKFIWR